MFGPFSTLLTAPAAQVAARYHYAFIEGAGGGPPVFSLKLPNLFAVSPVVADQLVPFAQWVASLPASERPKTAAYPMVNDPFAVPMVQNAQAILQKAGVKTVYSKIFPAENPDYKAGADQIAGAEAGHGGHRLAGRARRVSRSCSAFMQQHYNPKILAASAGPDQGAAFLSAIGGPPTPPAPWCRTAGTPGFNNPLSQAFVSAYIAKYGGTPADINADAAEAYSVGETLAAAVKATNSLSNAKVISYLHSGVTCRPCRARRSSTHRRERRGRALHLPVADRVEVRPGAADHRAWLGGDRQPEARLGQGLIRVVRGAR